MAFDISAYVSVGAWDADEEEEEEDDLPPPPPPVKTKKGSKKSNSDSGPIYEKSKVDLRQTKTFRRIEADLKHRRRQNLLNPVVVDPRMESYVDKDRAIAVVSGAEDLKGHVMKLRGDMMKSNRNCEHEAMTIQVTIEQAEHELKYGDPQKAYDYLGRALSIRPDRIDCLVLRGRCLIELSRYKDALEDADHILIKLKSGQNAKALAVKGEALYNLGNFEHALLNFHRAIRVSRTKEKEDLKIKICRAENAVINAVGPTASKYFRHMGSILNKLPTNIMGLPWIQLKAVSENDRSFQSKQSKNQDQKFLSEMAPDKQYLENIINKLSDQTYVKTQCLDEVTKEAENALSFLIERRDFWAQRNPDYPSLSDDDLNAEKTQWKSVFKKALVKKPNQSSIGFDFS